MLRTLMAKSSKTFFIIAITLIIYMPLHVFIVQSASLLTGGLDQWKAAKDIFIVVLVPLLLYISYILGLWRDRTFRAIMMLGGLYTLLHGLFVVFDQSDDTYSAIVGSVYNTRLLGYLLLGYLVGSAKQAQKYTKMILTAAVLIASAVSLFGVAQYFLPTDLLENVGYTVERGVKPLFFIDDKTELPRVMSTLKDPNSLGAYLLVPILLTASAFFKQSYNKLLFLRPFRRGVLLAMLGLQAAALLLTFSRGALIGLIFSIITLLCIVTSRRVFGYLRQYAPILVSVVLILLGITLVFQDSFVFQNIVFHADDSTVLADPNEKRVSLAQDAVEDVVEQPLGYGPGSAGLVAISNPQGGILTENYYLQIGYEVGWLGLALFLAIFFIILKQFFLISQASPLAVILFASAIGYAVISLLIHLWSNETIALQWWLIAGITLGYKYSFYKT